PKNSYLVFNASNPEDCLYGNAVNFCQDCCDNSHISKCEKCYQGFWLTACNNCHFSSQCENCFDLWFSKNCVGCSNCFGCAGLKNKSYCVWNKQYAKEEYVAILKSYNLGSYAGIQELKNKAEAFWLKFPVKFREGSHNLNVSGNYINHCKNVRDSFLVRECENMRYCQYVQEPPGSKDCYDYSIWGDSNQLVYECHASGIGLYNVKFCLFAQENSKDLEYCLICQSSSDLFGCVSLRKKQFCILNKQYSESEYRELTAKIRQQMSDLPYVDSQGRVYKYGEFLPIEMSPFGYNETMAQEYFPLTKEEALAQGYRWRDTAERDYRVTLPQEKLPDRIDEVPDSITAEIISCAHASLDSIPRLSASIPRYSASCNQLCTTAFKIIPAELQFYRKIGLPLPRLCPNCRTFERLKQRIGLKVYPRTCQCAGKEARSDPRYAEGSSEARERRAMSEKYQNTAGHFHGSGPCPSEFETTYSPDRPEIVYCESCYQAEVA
ncbi:MAG: hypothetical protein HY978_02855, partial [Candidatus Liptonbacteria bacterium]|nr:hypothetical protein [Candidatus Liptonbacteria bacterium]